MVDALAKMPLEFSPGDAWNYSLSTDVLGYLVGKIAGMPFEQFLRERILAPLGMRRYRFLRARIQVSRFAACYRCTPEQPLRLADDRRDEFVLETADLCVGRWRTRLDDGRLLALLSHVANGGTLDGVRIVSPKTLELMTANHLRGGKDLTQLSISLFSEATYAGVGFGLGFAVTVDSARTLLPGSVGDFSWGGMASTYFWIDPREDLIVIFMTQLMPSATYPIRRELRTLVYSAFD